uniref:Uncharacterized protein n=1 Tax=Rhizophora mucronata TaxID=61149 RepID=A0A2P2JLB5_RHIMU
MSSFSSVESIIMAHVARVFNLDDLSQWCLFRTQIVFPEAFILNLRPC